MAENRIGWGGGGGFHALLAPLLPQGIRRGKYRGADHDDYGALAEGEKEDEVDVFDPTQRIFVCPLPRYVSSSAIVLCA